MRAAPSEACDVCHMLAHMTVTLEVNSPHVRDALLDGCACVIRFETRDRETPRERLGAFDPQRCERRIALATALAEQLEAGDVVVDVAVEVADGVARNVA